MSRYACSFQPSPSTSQQRVKCESNILNESGFHPVSKDVNRIMKNFFDGEAADATKVVTAANTAGSSSSSASNGHIKVE